MPGDLITDDIEIQNTTEHSPVKIYLRIVPHNSESNPLSPEVAEHETIASMTDFLSKLSLKIYNGSELIYSASPDQPDTLTDYHLLGEFRKEELATLHVELTVPANLDSTYAHRFGEVDWMILTEDTSTSKTTNPNTGLFTNAPSFLVPTLSLIPIAIIIAILINRLRRKSH